MGWWCSTREGGYRAGMCGGGKPDAWWLRCPHGRRRGALVACCIPVRVREYGYVWVAGKYFAPGFPPQSRTGSNTSSIIAGTLGNTPGSRRKPGHARQVHPGGPVPWMGAVRCDSGSRRAADSPCPKNFVMGVSAGRQGGDTSNRGRAGEAGGENGMSGRLQRGQGSAGVAIARLFVYLLPLA